jgi:DNA mismatch repair ATPase MutS
VTTFITDKQTTDELGLLGRYQPGSAYGLFNKARTNGGQRLMEEMLRHPLTEAPAINQRTDIFRYFQQKAYPFPLDGEVVNAFSNMLDSGCSKTRLGNLLSTYQKKLLASVVHDDRYHRQHTGVQLATGLLRELHGFLSGKNAGLGAHPYEERMQAIQVILSDKRIERLRNLADKQTITPNDIAWYDHLLKHSLRRDMETVLQFIYELDVYIAVSEVARDKGFCYAVAVNERGNLLDIKNLRHPALDKGVGNDLSLDSNRNLLFLTGANMAGKSTLMKSTGIALYLAHAGFPVAADEMFFTIKDGLYSSINVPDNINLGYSHFYAEVLRVKSAAELVSGGKNMLVMFDELFKGTNVKDAYEGTLEVARAFARYTNCLFIISTHIIEVGEALKGNGHILFGYMPTIMEGGRPKYPYRLTEGITEDRQGMIIIQNEGIPELLK